MSSVPGNRWDLLDGVLPAHPPAVSAVVVHYAQPLALERTLDALRAQTHPTERLEVIVVDDGSPQPPTVPAGVRLLRQADRGVRPGSARNLGVTAASGEVVCFLDADTTPEPGYVEALTRLPALLPEAVTVARRRHADLSDGAPLSLAGERELPEPAWLREGYARSRDLLDADDRSYRFVISATLCCTRSFFGEVGPFADFTAYGGEDWEWAHRAWRAGAVLAHVAEAVAWHDGPDWSARGESPQRRRQKNDETRRLAGLIPVPGSVGRGLRAARAEVVIELAATQTAAQAFVCVDGLLEAFPRAAVLVPDAVAPAFADDARVAPASTARDPAFAWPGLRITALRAVEVDAEGLRTLADEVRDRHLARVTLDDKVGPLLMLDDVRSRARARRSHDRHALIGERRRAECVAALEPDPDLEAWLGGWANSRLPSR